MTEFVHGVCTKIANVIVGGALEDIAWAPTTSMKDNSDFMAITRTDRRLAKFIGVELTSTPLSDNKLFDKLTCARNTAVDRLILERLNEQDPLAKSRSTPGKKSARAEIDPAPLPPTVAVRLPPLHYEEGEKVVDFGDTTIVCLTETTRLRLVSVEFTAANLAYIRFAALLAARRPRRRKRAARVVTCGGVKGVYADTRRKTLVTWWKDPAEPFAKKKRIALQPEEWEQPHINQCALTLAEAQVNGPIVPHRGVRFPKSELSVKAEPTSPSKAPSTDHVDVITID